MRKMLLVTICFFALMFVYAKPTFALPAVCNLPSCCGGEGSPLSCGDLGSGEVLEMVIKPYDNEGTWMFGVPIDYIWSVSSPDLGTLSVTTDSNSNGGSQSTITAPVSSYGASGQVNVSATYGGTTITKVFLMTGLCTAEPLLYYGIGSVGDGSGSQSSTAEVILGCKSDYMLYEGTGEGS